MKPYEESIDLRRAWCWDKVNGLDLGELILKQDSLIVTVRKEAGLKVEKPISWDTNLLDGYDGERHHSINLK
ncbi:MAG: hypothetical protein QXK57_00620 [Conexivisphaerales archaeon]